MFLDLIFHFQNKWSLSLLEDGISSILLFQNGGKQVPIFSEKENVYPNAVFELNPKTKTRKTLLKTLTKQGPHGS